MNTNDYPGLHIEILKNMVTHVSGHNATDLPLKGFHPCHFFIDKITYPP